MPRKVLAIGHRGACGLMPENTKLSFFKALDLGADAIEFDVQLTRDGVPIVLHDDTLNRTTSGKGRVAETDFAVVRRLDAGAWYGASFAGKAEVPTLAEVLKALGHRTLLNVEMKVTDDFEPLVKHVVTEVAREDVFDNVLFSSFQPLALEFLCSLVPDVRIGVLCESKNQERAMEFARRIGAETFNPPWSIVDAELMAKARHYGLKVWTWTVNDRRDIYHLCELGVDGIFSDYPDRVVAAQRV